MPVAPRGEFRARRTSVNAAFLLFLWQEAPAFPAGHGGMLPGSLGETALPAALINFITEARAGLKALKEQNSA